LLDSLWVEEEEEEGEGSLSTMEASTSRFTALFMVDETVPPAVDDERG
jgi:hypothetical protein